MKSFTILRLPLVILVLGGAFLLVPQSRAQSEIAPDHFDGTDSWAITARAPMPATNKHSALAALQVVNAKPAAPALQTVAVRSVTISHRSDATANKQRKPAAPKSSN
jgi:hypothetical protein